MLVVE